MTKPARKRSIAHWERQLRSPQSWDRCDAAEKPPRGNRSRVVRGLIAALNDADSLVRTCAAESLSLISDSDAVRKALRRRCQVERECLARAYAMSSLGRIGDLSDVAYLAGVIRRARNDHVRVHAVAGLILAARRMAKTHLKHGLRARHPGTRGTSAGILADMVLMADQDRPEVIQLLKKALRIEKRRLIEGDFREYIKELERRKR